MITHASRARSLLAAVGYGDDVIDFEYPVWLGRDRGVALADLVAFGRAVPRDMSTATLTLTEGSVESGFEIARILAAPFFMVDDDRRLDLWVADPAGPRPLQSDVGPGDAAALAESLQPRAAMTMKIGLRQLPLFDLPVNLLASARSRSADQLAPIVAEALQAASDSLPSSRSANPDRARQLLHRRAARLVVGALTALVMRDRGEDRPTEAAALLDRVAREQPTTFEWMNKISRAEHNVLVELLEQLGAGIDYRSLDPSILSHVYEQALVNDDDRRRLGIHYTPPNLAARLLRDLPVELVPPEDRHVLDPACGSGTLLIAAHDRLRELQPANWEEETRHRDLSVHLRGFDVDPFAGEIARLSLLLHAQPAGNGWRVDEVDTLRQPPPEMPPKLIVTNPPWRFSADEHRAQAADEFVRWSMRALAPGGLLGMVLPGSWLSADNSSESRDELLAYFEVFEVWRLPEGTFSTSRQPPAVLLARKRDGLGGAGARIVREVSSPELRTFMAGEPGAINFLHLDKLAPLGAGPPPPTVRRPAIAMGDIADVLSGPQPLPGIADRGTGTPYLNHFGDVPPYGLVPDELLWHVGYPEDFQTGSGGRLIDKKKVIASAARSWSSPWRFRVAIDLTGVAVRNSVRGIAPHDQDDDDLLYAIAMIVGSGFASAYAVSVGGDRNIPAKVLPSMPFPKRRSTVTRLARFGRRAAELAAEPGALNEHLIAAEAAVWEAYGVDETDRRVAIARLAGHSAPEGLLRYPALDREAPEAPSRFRRVGAVLGIEGNSIRLWVNGVTPDEGVVVPLPARLPGWLARSGATFDVTGIETTADLTNSRFSYQPMSWRDIDIESDEPRLLIPR